MRWLGIGIASALAVTMLAVAVVALDDEEAAEPGARAAAAAPERPAAAPLPAAPAVAVIWGMDDARRAARRLARSRGVKLTTVLRRGTTLLRSARRRDGRVIQRVRAGFAIPLDVLSVDPRAYAAALPPPARRPVASLDRGRVLLSATSARLRQVGAGASLTLVGGRRLRVAAVVPDELAQGAELLAADSEGMPSARDSVLAVLRAGARPSERRLARVAGGGRARLAEPLGSATAADRSTPRFDGPARPAELKARFGEPAVALPYGDDWVTLDPGFLRRHIVTRSVPVLGAVTCHRRVLPALRAAMRQLARRGLGRLVDPADYAGCYAARRIRPGGALSLHAWGLALDLNARANPFGGRSRQDRRLVAAMERHGFSWGGDFPTTPDPMHFEFRGR